MPREEIGFDKELFASYFEQWESIRSEIETFYDKKDSQAIDSMKSAIERYTELLQLGGQSLDPRSGEMTYTLLPLNGEERLAFVKSKINSHYSFVQLDALFTETKKKVARLAIMKN